MSTTSQAGRRKVDLIVLGAGMVGVCTAWHLAQRGHAVTLVDRRAPGQETSYGNAGIIQREAVEPYPFPQTLGHLWRVATRRGADVHYHLSALPGLARPLAGYWVNSRPGRYEKLAQAYARLIAHSTSEHEPLIRAAGAESLVQRKGYMHVFRSESTRREALIKAQRMADNEGVRFDVLSGEALAAAEPALKRRMAGAIHWLDPWSVNDPGELVTQYAALLPACGVHVVQGEAFTLQSKAGGWCVETVDGWVEAQHAVVALGPWSDRLLLTLGYRYPLFAKRGYHAHYKGGQAPNLPLLDADVGYAMAPMRQGVRLTTGAEFARLDAPPTPVQVAQVHRAASELLNLPIQVEAKPWLGARPCTADLLPVIGPAPRHPGLWFNFGHAHQGFTLGPVSGRLLADLIEGLPPLVNAEPYLPARFE